MAGNISVTVKHKGAAIQLALPPGSTLQALQEQLEARCGVLARHQKLILSGKVISGAGPKVTLEQAGVRDGAKVMLLATGAEAGPSGGQAALAAAAQQRTEDHKRRMARGAAPPSARALPPATLAPRAEAWRRTGIAALRDLKLESLPPELLALGGGLRVLDAGGNRLAALPPSLSQLSGLQRLRLSLNSLTDGGTPWRALAALPRLVVLALDSNQLTCLPDCVSGLSCLQKLTANGNRLESIPDSIGQLTALRALALRGNRLAALPPGLGRCLRLEEADLADNRLAALPPELSHLTSLKALLLDKNRIKSVPPGILTGCVALQTLTLHENPVTAEQMRETPGFAEFDARRKAKHDKGLCMRLEQSFDEGFDAVEFERYK